jgi:L-fuconolactonase
MKIDAHQHFWVYNPVRDSWIDDSMDLIRGDFLPNDLLPILQSNGIDGCIAVQTDQSEGETMFLLALAEKYESFIKGVVGWVDLCSEKIYDRLEVFSQFEQLKGFRHILQAEPDGFMLQPAFARGIRQLAAFDFTYDLLIYPNQLQAALQLINEAPDVKFVIDHAAKPYIREQKIADWANDIRAIAKHPQLHCKLSGLVTEHDWNHWKAADFYPYLDVIFEAFGTDRLLFGSDWPVCILAAEYEQVLYMLQNYMDERGISASAQAQVMGLNAVRFYGIEL